MAAAPRLVFNHLRSAQEIVWLWCQRGKEFIRTGQEEGQRAGKRCKGWDRQKDVHSGGKVKYAEGFAPVRCFQKERPPPPSSKLKMRDGAHVSLDRIKPAHRDLPDTESPVPPCPRT